jgi:hypothetical protein
MIEVWHRPLAPCGERWEVTRSGYVVGRYPSKGAAAEAAQALRGKARAA